MMHKIAKGKNHNDPYSNAMVAEKTQKMQP